MVPFSLRKAKSIKLKYEGVKRLRELKAKSLPCSVAPDGELVFESIITMQEELIAEIEKRYKGKNQDAEDLPERRPNGVL